MEDSLQLLVDLHKCAKRQGPGGDIETLRALQLTQLDHTSPVSIADIGCGTGASAICLAKALNARITAVDFLPDFIQVLEQRVAQEGLAEKIQPLVASMDTLPFPPASLDMIWSEGAIYNIGFERGINDWRGLLKPGGILVASEITWTRSDRPKTIEQYWQQHYPEIATAAEKINQLEQAGYSLLGYFSLPGHCWLENYYRPLQASFASFLSRHSHSAEASALVAAEEEEIALYEQFGDYYSYGVYIAHATDGA